MSVDVEPAATDAPRRASRLRVVRPSEVGGGARGAVLSAARALRPALAAVRSAWLPVRRAVAPVLAVVGPAGWLLLGVVLAGAWVGRRLGWSEAWTAAVVAAVLLLVAVGFVVGRSSFRVRLGMQHQRVVVGERATGTVVVTNTGNRTTLPARVELPVGAGQATFPLPRLAASAEHEDVFVVPTRRRGLIVLGPVRSVRGDPLGLLRRQVRWTDPMELYVHPRTVTLDGASAGFLRDIEGLPTQDLSSNDIAFHALRDYVAGDDRRSIHWRTTARTGRLVVRQFEETRRSHLVVAMTTRTGDYACDDEVELAVSVAGSLGLQTIREEKQLSVLTSRGPVRAATSRRFLDGLSVLETDERGTGLAQLGVQVGATVPDASAVILVAGTAVESATLLAASLRLPVDALAVAIRCAPGEQVARRVLGGLVVVTLGALDDLPLVMRRVSA